METAAIGTSSAQKIARACEKSEAASNFPSIVLHRALALSMIAPLARDLLVHRLTMIVCLLVAIAVPASARAQQELILVPLPAQGTSDSAPAHRVYPIDPERAPRPTMRAVRAPKAPVIDGRLDEPEWALADSATEFVQQLPVTGAPAEFRTVVRVLYDSDHVYVSSINYDPTPGLAITAGLQRDFSPSNTDVFAVALDT